MGLIEDRDLWKMIQVWFICDFRYIVHKRWLRQAVLAGKLATISVESYALSTRKFEAVKFKPRGWTWVDPTVEVEAYKEAVKSGFTTVGDVIAATADGRDIEDVMNERERELKMMASKGLVFETSPEFYDKEDPPPKPANVAGNEQNPPPRRVFSFGSKQ
jgi:capsid protein